MYEEFFMTFAITFTFVCSLLIPCNRKKWWNHHQSNLLLCLMKCPKTRKTISARFSQTDLLFNSAVQISLRTVHAAVDLDFYCFQSNLRFINLFFYKLRKFRGGGLRCRIETNLETPGTFLATKFPNYLRVRPWWFFRVLETLESVCARLYDVIERGNL